MNKIKAFYALFNKSIYAFLSELTQVYRLIEMMLKFNCSSKNSFKIVKKKCKKKKKKKKKNI